MNLFHFIQKELYAARLEANRPLFQDNTASDYFYTELFDYYQSCKNRIIDTHSGESVFSVTTGNAYSINAGHLRIKKTQHQNLFSTSTPAVFQTNWKPA